MRCTAVWILAVGLVTFGVLSAPIAGVGEDRKLSTERMWRQLLGEAHVLRTGPSNKVPQSSPAELRSV